MTPLQIEIMLHYYTEPGTHPGDYRDGEFSHPAIEEAINGLVENGMLERGHNSYCITQGGNLYVETLCDVPIPVKKWVMP